MLRTISALAIAGLTTACIGDSGTADHDQQAQSLSLNLNANAIKSANQRVEEAFSEFLNSGIYGARVKRVGGSASVSLNDQIVFDPASALKVAHFTYALGTEFGSLNAPFAFQYPSDPQNPNLTTACPDDAWIQNTVPVQTSIANGLALMMQNSDNRVTRGFESRYTRVNLNAMMADLGMPNSSLQQFIGCGYNNGLRNRTTARDLTHLYERVAAGSVLQGAPREAFFNILIQGVPARVQQVINDEGAKLGKSAAFMLDFLNKTKMRSKGGSYNICDSPTCNTYEYVRSQAGLLTLPIKPQCSVVHGQLQVASASAERDIAYARYITALTIPCSPQGPNESLNAAENRCTAFAAANDAMNAAEVEMFRSEIRAALLTFDAPCTPGPVVKRGRLLTFSPPTTAPAPGIDPDEIDYDEQTRDGAAAAPTPGVEPDEIDYDEQTRDGAAAPTPGVEPDEIDRR